MTTTKFLPAVHDLELYDGDGHTIEYECVNENDALMNLAAYTWLSQWRRSKSATDAVDLELDVSDAAVGIIRVHWSAAIMAAIGKKGFWDLQGQLPPDDPITPVGGKVTKVLDVTA